MATKAVEEAVLECVLFLGEHRRGLLGGLKETVSQRESDSVLLKRQSTLMKLICHHKQHLSYLRHGFVSVVTKTKLKVHSSLVAPQYTSYFGIPSPI